MGFCPRDIEAFWVLYLSWRARCLVSIFGGFVYDIYFCEVANRSWLAYSNINYYRFVVY